ncbi:MAG TPA: hypothetical protein H9698_08415 [Candidatus Ruthenibacterium merdavium]|uniref:Uncharacterized protein n=1 Tax=Candidatus Ruthenibacterium merdavium TaxID=2838752 RepID=A0A9D2Q5I5_9FIRM|nr:hypothetical protein [Candidatus Ruthenibacterium merdavium]
MGSEFISLIYVLFFVVLVLYAVWLRKRIDYPKGSSWLNLVNTVLIWCAAFAFLAQLPIHLVQQSDAEGRFSWLVSLDPWVKIVFGVSIVLHAAIVFFYKRRKHS